MASATLSTTTGEEAQYSTVTRRQQARSQWPSIRMGPFFLNPAIGLFRVGDQAYGLTPIETDLMYYLMAHPGIAFGCEVLLSRVWHYALGMGNASLVRMHVKNIRAKTGCYPLNRARFGYFMPKETEKVVAVDGQIC